jgi:hypothetical protein
MMTLTRTEESTAVVTAVVPTLLLAFELGERTWKLGFTMGLGQPPRIRQIPARARCLRHSLLIKQPFFAQWGRKILGRSAAANSVGRT